MHPVRDHRGAALGCLAWGEAPHGAVASTCRGWRRPKAALGLAGRGRSAAAGLWQGEGPGGGGTAAGARAGPAGAPAVSRGPGRRQRDTGHRGCAAPGRGWHRRPAHADVFSSRHAPQHRRGAGGRAAAGAASAIRARGMALAWLGQRGIRPPGAPALFHPLHPHRAGRPEVRRWPGPGRGLQLDVPDAVTRCAVRRAAGGLGLGDARPALLPPPQPTRAGPRAGTACAGGSGGDGLALYHRQGGGAGHGPGTARPRAHPRCEPANAVPGGAGKAAAPWHPRHPRPRRHPAGRRGPPHPGTGATLCPSHLRGDVHSRRRRLSHRRPALSLRPARPAHQQPRRPGQPQGEAHPPAGGDAGLGECRGLPRRQPGGSPGLRAGALPSGDGLPRQRRARGAGRIRAARPGGQRRLPHHGPGAGLRPGPGRGAAGGLRRRCAPRGGDQPAAFAGTPLGALAGGHGALPREPPRRPGHPAGKLRPHHARHLRLGQRPADAAASDSLLPRGQGDDALLCRTHRSGALRRMAPHPARLRTADGPGRPRQAGRDLQRGVGDAAVGRKTGGGGGPSTPRPNRHRPLAGP